MTILTMFLFTFIFTIVLFVSSYEKKSFLELAYCAISCISVLVSTYAHSLHTQSWVMSIMPFKACYSLDKCFVWLFSHRCRHRCYHGVCVSHTTGWWLLFEDKLSCENNFLLSLCFSCWKPDLQFVRRQCKEVKAEWGL